MSYSKDSGKDYLSFDNNQVPLPNSTAVLVLGILSIVFCFAYGILGVVLGTIGLVLGNKDRAAYRDLPDRYTAASYSTLNAGRTCAIIGLSCSILFIVAILIFAVFVSTNLMHYRYR